MHSISMYMSQLCIGGVYLKLNKELLKGSTTLLILNLLNHKSMYGYQMIKELSEKSENIFELKEGTLYPILHSLEEKGFVTSYWEDTPSRKRKYYSITKLGKKTLEDKQKEWDIFTSSVNKVLGGVLFGY